LKFLDVTLLRSALEQTRQKYFTHRALYKNTIGNAFGDRLRKLISERLATIASSQANSA
jgi:hypothetical protein